MAKNSKQDSDNYKNNKIAKIGITRIHSGPLPDSETLIKYNQVYPDLAKEIVEMAKKQSEHRQYLEREQVISETKLKIERTVNWWLCYCYFNNFRFCFNSK